MVQNVFGNVLGGVMGIFNREAADALKGYQPTLGENSRFIGVSGADLVHLSNGAIVIPLKGGRTFAAGPAGVVAAPAFKAIGEQVLPCVGVYPKGVTVLAKGGRTGPPVGEGSGEPASASAAGLELPEEPGVMPDFSGKSLRQVVLASQRLGLDLKLVGTGRVVSQTPAPGHVLQGQTRGVVKFEPAS
jgi:hypothetical protein